MNVADGAGIDLLVKSGMDGCHAAMLDFLDSANLPDLLGRENPYQLARRGGSDAGALVRALLDKGIEERETAHLDGLLEELAAQVVATARGGWKSGRRGIDLEFRDGNAWHIVTLIPFPFFDDGNEILEVEDCFNAAANDIERNNPFAKAIPVIGCVYGREPVAERDGYYKYCGQDFWQLISGDAGLYTRIVEPLRRASAWRDGGFTENYARKLNSMTAQFYRRFCDERGFIDWEKVTAFVSDGDEEPAPR